MLSQLGGVALQLVRCSAAIGKRELVIACLQASLNRLLGQGTVSRRTRLRLLLLGQQSRGREQS